MIAIKMIAIKMIAIKMIAIKMTAIKHQTGKQSNVHTALSWYLFNLFVIKLNKLTLKKSPNLNSNYYNFYN